jgi:hypothetical protein
MVLEKIFGDNFNLPDKLRYLRGQITYNTYGKETLNWK